MPIRTSLVACTLIAWLAGAAGPAFAQSEIPVPHPVPGPSAPSPGQRLSGLIAAVQALRDAHGLTAHGATQLTGILNDADGALMRGKVREMTRHLEAFASAAQALVASRALRSSDANPLIAEAAAIGAQVEQMAFRPGSARPASWSFEGCAEPRPCSYVVVFVSQRTTVRGQRDGSPDRPFRTIAAALAYADAVDACGVEVRVADGIYREDVAITRSTTVDGESRDGVVLLGAIVNNAGAALTVRDVTLSAVDGPGGIFTDALCAITTVTNIRMDGSVRFGIYQRGGVLTVVGATIRRTIAGADSRASGAAIYLTGGVQAVIGLVELTANQSGAILATGSQTRVYATSVTIDVTTVNPFFAAEASWFDEVPTAVDVRDGALLLMEFSTISRSELAGLRARTGAQAHFRYGVIARTRQIAGFEDRGTANAVATSDGTILELSDFTLRRGSLAGLFIHEAFATASHGIIRGHPIGVALQGMPPPGAPDYTIESAVECLRQDVSYVDNASPLDSPFLPIPCPGGACPLAACRRVPFVCTWCEQ